MGLLEGKDMSDNIALETLNQYLSGEIDFNTLKERIIPLGFDDDFEHQDLVDMITIEIAYILDGISDEPLFRERIVEAVESYCGPGIVRRSRLAHKV